MIRAFNGLPFRRLPEQPGRGDTCCSPRVGRCYLLLCDDREAIDWRRVGRHVTDELAIAAYRIICVFHGANGHSQAVGYSESGHEVMYDDVWMIEQARHAIERGHRLYTVSPSTGAQAELELYGDGIRTKPEQSTDNTLEDLPRRG